MKEKGIVAKIKNSYCIVLTRNGTYHRVPLAGRRNVRVGAEIEFSSFNWSAYTRPALLVASILIFVLGFGLFRMSAAQASFAYVSLDINPSVEMEVTKDLKVLSIRPVNSDAEKLMSGMQLQGSDLYTCIDSVLAKAAESGYLKPGQKNYVLSAVTVKNGSPAPINYDEFARNMESSLTNKGLNIEIVMISADMKLRNEARSKGLTAGKYTVYKEAVAYGDKVTVNDVKDNSITKLVNEYKIHLLPNNKKLIIKSIHVSPGRRSQSDSGDTVGPGRGHGAPGFGDNSDDEKWKEDDEKRGSEQEREKDRERSMDEKHGSRNDQEKERLSEGEKATGKNQKKQREQQTDNNRNMRTGTTGDDDSETDHDTVKDRDTGREQDADRDRDTDRDQDSGTSGSNQGQVQTPAPSDHTDDSESDQNSGSSSGGSGGSPSGRP